MQVVELVATVSGVVCVWLTIRRNIWCWPVGLVMVTLYAWIFYDARLYSDAILQVIYIFLQIYGWYFWLHGGQEKAEAPIVRLSHGAVVLWIVVATSGTFVWGALMAHYTDASLPYWDAATTVISLVAQYLMARKVLESWGFWIVVDVIAVGVYAVKGLYLTMGLYGLFLGMATAGYLAWRRNMSGEHPVPEPA